MKYILLKIISFYKFNYLNIAPYRISTKIDNSNKLNLNLYEVKIESSIIENLSLLETLLF